MSYPYSSGEQPSYPYATSTYSTSVPQYTQSQINAYYQQYQVYPQQPYQIIPDYYSQPVGQAVPGYSSTMASTQGTQGYYGESAGSIAMQEAKSGRPRTWACDLPNCTSTANFTRLADLQRHQSTVHGVGMPDFPCTVARCTRVGDKGFTRRDHLVEHLRNFHHLDIPKRRPGERSANPLGLPEYRPQ